MFAVFFAACVVVFFGRATSSSSPSSRRRDHERRRRNAQLSEKKLATLSEGTIASLLASLTALNTLDARNNPLRCPLQPICGDGEPRVRR